MQTIYSVNELAERWGVTPRSIRKPARLSQRPVGKPAAPAAVCADISTATGVFASC